MSLLTTGHLLGGRLLYAQRSDGHRTGIEPVLLAAAIPAQPGERVLEAGTGAGAGLLCLAARVPGLDGVGVEIDPDMADLARRNLAANAQLRLSILTADLAAASLPPCDHAFANPPWHDPRATASPDALRRRAKQAAPGDLARWLAAMARPLAPAGTLTVILPAAQAAAAASAMRGAGRGRISLLWLHPKPGRPAKLVLVQARHGEGTTEREFVLHEADGAFTPAAQAVLRAGAPLAPL